jgi:hypothetical protein
VFGVQYRSKKALHRSKITGKHIKYHLFSIILLVTLIGAFSCTKDEYPPPGIQEPLIYVPIFEPCDTLTGMASAMKLTKPWRAGVTCRSYLKDGIKKRLVEMKTCEGGRPIAREFYHRWYAR